MGRYVRTSAAGAAVAAMMMLAPNAIAALTPDAIVFSDLKVSGPAVLVTVRTPTPATVTITGRGVVTTVELIPSGRSTLAAVLTHPGHIAARGHKPFTVTVRVKTGSPKLGTMTGTTSGQV